MRISLVTRSRACWNLAGLLLLASCGGGGDSGGGSPPPTNNLVFFTSTTHDGNLGASGSAALAAADGICNARAQVAGLPGGYVAWLSTSTVSAKDRLGTSRGWVRTDGLPFVDTVADLVAGKVLYPPRTDENGAVATAKVQVFTGTQGNGSIQAGLACADWSSNAGGNTMEIGFADAGGRAWTASGFTACVNKASLYCFGVGSSAPLSFTPAAGRLAFLSAGRFAMNTGIGAADTLCQNEATAAGRPGTFKALLATTTTSAASRFSTAGATWVTPDGVRVFASAADLATTTMIAPIDVTAVGNAAVVTLAALGAPSFSAVGTAATTCSNWSSNASTDQASLSGADQSIPLIFPSSCATGGGSLPVMCLQQ